ncbi:MAG: glucose-1-phosphate thymidylyltransferase, partial [Bacteroidia bacterium]|nr:glucose-1-phosphate thymidylyltransferase [Bacteroidia bacterium]
MNLVLFDDPLIRPHLLPFTYTRPVANIRCGILTLNEKWEKYLGLSSSYLTQDYLRKNSNCKTATDNLMVNGAV